MGTLFLGVALVVLGLIWIGQNRGAPAVLASPSSAELSSAGADPAASGQPPPPPSPAPGPPPAGPAGAVDGSPTPAGTSPAPSAGSSSGTPTEAAAPVITQTAPPPAVLGAPVGLNIPAQSVHAPVDPILTIGGVLHPPDDPARVGWWMASAPPGGGGPTVLVGHVDSATAGAGALIGVAHLRLGDRITVDRSDGGTAEFVVTERQVYVKADGLPAALFDLGGPPRLVVITCGGEFDESTRSYEDNVVVLAEPAT